MPKFKTPEGCTGVSLLGVWYETDADGCVTIPHNNVEDLASHGFEQIHGEAPVEPVDPVDPVEPVPAEADAPPVEPPEGNKPATGKHGKK